MGIRQGQPESPLVVPPAPGAGDEFSRRPDRTKPLVVEIVGKSVAANFVEMRRVTSELADVERALAEAEDAWLELEELAP